MPTVLKRIAGATGLALAYLVAGIAAMPAAYGAGCTVMTFGINPSSGALELSPSTVTVDDGACVSFSNNTVTTAQFTVGTGYKATAAAFSSATPNYVAHPAGTTQPVTASSAAGTAHGSIVIRPAPQQSSSTPAPHHTSSAPPPGKHPAPKAAKASPRPRPVPTPTASPPPRGPVVSPPAASTPYLAGMPTPTPTPSPSRSGAAVVAGPLQPPTDRGTGLPAAVAALAVAATAAGLVRVLLAEPLPGAVDDGPGTVRTAV